MAARTLYFQMEMTAIKDGGGDMGISVLNPIILKGMQVDVSMLFKTAAPGWAECLCNVWRMPGQRWSTWEVPGPAGYVNANDIIDPPDLKYAGVASPGGNVPIGGAGHSGTLC